MYDSICKSSCILMYFLVLFFLVLLACPWRLIRTWNTDAFQPQISSMHTVPQKKAVAKKKNIAFTMWTAMRFFIGVRRYGFMKGSTRMQSAETCSDKKM